jgi:hypothetical protein
LASLGTPSHRGNRSPPTKVGRTGQGKSAVIWETPPTTQALSATGSVQRRKVGSAGAGFRPPTAGSLRPTSCGGVINGPPDASCQCGRHFVRRRSVTAMFARNAALLVAASWGRWNQWQLRRVLPQDSPHGRASCSRLRDGKRRSANSPAFAEVCSAGTVGGRRRVEAASKAWNRVCRPTCDARVGQLACRRSRRPARNQGRQ